MTITINGPDGSTFNFPDDTAPDVIKGAMAKHYGAPWAAAGPKPSGDDVSAISAAEGLPIVGAYAPKAAAYLRHLAQGGTTAEHQKQIEADIADYQAKHPVASTVGQLAVGSLPFAAAGGVPALARGLGMVGPLRTAALAGGASGTLIGATDAAARGQDPVTGGIIGGLSGVGGVVGGKAVGRIWDAARGMFVDTPRVPNRMPIPGLGADVRVAEPVVTRDPKAAAEVQDFLGANDPIATRAEAQTRQDLNDAHDLFEARLDPTRTSTGTTSREAGNTAAADLVRQEQQRAQDEIQRIAGVQGETGNLRQAFGGVGPTSTQDIGQGVGQGIRGLATGARGARTQAYETLGNVPGEWNPRYLLNVGENRIRPALDNPTSVGLPASERVYVKPDLMPQTSGALQDIDHEMGRLAFTNDVARGNRPIVSADIEEVRKLLVQRMQAANQAARASGNWQDVRGMRRLMEEFDRQIEDIVTAPGGFTGNSQDYINAQQAARQSHATYRQRFGRQGAGDVVGTFMENAIGKYPGQEMSPEKIISSIMGKPGGAIPENAVPILNHLRDRVFGPNSQEWAAIKRAVISNMAETPAGGSPVALTELADRIDRFLGNQRHADAILSRAEQAQLATHSGNLRNAADVAPQRGTVADMVASLSGRGGQRPATGEEIISRLMTKGGGDLAVELARVLPQETMGQIKQGIFRKVMSAPEGGTEWGDQKITNSIAKFLQTDLANKLFTPNELQVWRAIQHVHQQLIPLPRTTNPSGSYYGLKRMAKGLSKQFLKIVMGTHGGAPGYIAAEGIGRGMEKMEAAQAARRAADLFEGRKTPLPRQAQYAPHRVGAFAGQLIAPSTDQAP